MVKCKNIFDQIYNYKIMINAFVIENDLSKSIKLNLDIYKQKPSKISKYIRLAVENKDLSISLIFELSIL